VKGYQGPAEEIQQKLFFYGHSFCNGTLGWKPQSGNIAMVFVWGEGKGHGLIVQETI